MQVASERPLSDDESVALGVDLLLSSWAKYRNEPNQWSQVRSTIADYNRDEDYISRVMEVMEIVAIRAAPELRPSYDQIWE